MVNFKNYMFNVVIIGGQSCGDYEFFRQKCIYYLSEKAKSGDGITIYTIGDEFVDKFTERYHIDKYVVSTDWTSYGKQALKYRNEALFKKANALIYFNTNKKDDNIIFSTAQNLGIPCRKVDVPQTT